MSALSILTRLLISAVVQAVITGGATLAASATDGKITGVEWILIVSGACVAAAKDMQAHLATSPVVKE